MAYRGGGQPGRRAGGSGEKRHAVGKLKAGHRFGATRRSCRAKRFRVPCAANPAWIVDLPALHLPLPVRAASRRMVLSVLYRSSSTTAPASLRCGAVSFHSRDKVLSTRSPPGDGFEGLGERHVQRMHPFPVENIDGARKRGGDRWDENRVAPVLEFLNDEPRHEGFFDFDQRRFPDVFAL